MLSCGPQDSPGRRRRMEQVVSSHFTREEAEGVCLMPFDYVWQLPFFFLFVLFPFLLGYLSIDSKSSHTGDYNKNQS